MMVFNASRSRRLARRSVLAGIVLGATVLGGALLGGCTDARLAKSVDDDVPVFDNKVALTGKFCTSDPSDLQFPLKVLFIIDTSQSMNVNDPLDLTELDTTQATGRSRSIRGVITKFIDLGLQFPPVYCNTGVPGCERGSTSCASCGAAGTNLCVGPECWVDPNTWSSGIPLCPPPATFNGTCLPLCDVTKAGCLPGEKNCPDCPNPNDRCIKGVCGKQLDPGVKFAIIRFGSAKQVITRDENGQEGFTNDPRELVTALPQVNNGGSVTDYEGALSEAFNLLSRDMRDARDAGTTALNRSKYVVIFLSDGQPDPRINGQDDWDSLPSGVKQDLLQGNPEDIITNYNVPTAILRRVSDIMSLKAVFRVGNIKLHTAYLSGDAPAWKQEQATGLLEQMANIGQGTFRNFKNGEAINFLDVDFSTLKRVFRLKNFIVSNSNGRPSGGLTIKDSDGDGIEDRLERAAGMDPTKLDTDNDGFSDTLEYFFRTSGWDPLDPTDADCSLAANDRDGDGKIDDTDGDGLYDCEERFLGTNRNLFDSDADGIPDGLEVRFGTNPVTNDVLADLDFDGMPNGDEIRLHTDPRSDDAAHRSRASYRYKVVRTGDGIETVGTSCSVDDDCPQKKSCIGGYCQCGTVVDCSTQTACATDAECTVAGESCDNSVCTSKATCELVTDALPKDKVCATRKNITCYDYKVENVQLVTTAAGPTQPDSGWNLIYLYMGEAPFDNPDGFGNFKVACFKARYNDKNGAKLPPTGNVAMPFSAWKDPGDLNPDKDCVCPDGKVGVCEQSAAP